jgi:hypothetical protein
MGNPLSVGPTVGSDQKYCTECGQRILRKAEICPHCGCRQMPPPHTGIFGSRAPSLGSSANGSYDTIRLILLLVLNLLWNGLGNIAVGDHRGWKYALFNVLLYVPVLLLLLTLGPIGFVPTLAFYAYCAYQGYSYLEAEKRQLTRP